MHTCLLSVCCLFSYSIFRARAGNLQGPYCFSNDSLLIRALAGNDLQSPYFFSHDCYFFPLSEMIAFFTARTYPKTHQTWNISYTSRKIVFIVVLNFHIQILEC